MATEIAILPLNPGEHPDDPNSVPGKTLTECLQILRSRKGLQRLYWGREVENPDVMRLFVDWDAVQDHKNFIDSDVYKPFLDRFGTILGGDPILYHAHFDPHPPQKALSDGQIGVTEVINAFFPANYSAADQKTVSENMQKLFDAVAQSAQGFNGATGGWVEEELPIPDSQEKGKVYVGLIGWAAVKAHMDFRETQEFKDNIHLLRAAKDLKAVKMIHADCRELQALPSES